MATTIVVIVSNCKRSLGFGQAKYHTSVGRWFAREVGRLSDSKNYASADIDELLDLSRANAQALVIATTTFFDMMQLPSNDWTRFLGEVFASSWDTDTALDAGVFLEAMLTNYQSFGATVVQSSLEASHASAAIHGFPNPELCVELDCNCHLADAYFDVPFPLAERFDLRWSWRRDGDLIRLEVDSQTS